MYFEVYKIVKKYFEAHKIQSSEEICTPNMTLPSTQNNTRKGRQ